MNAGIKNCIKEKAENYQKSTEFLFNLLFIVFTHFMETNYSGITRHLLKMFVNTLEPVIRELLLLNENNNIGYLIAIFENFICDSKIKRDTLDLLHMRNILISDENAKKMNLFKSLEGTTVCKLDRISPPEVKSKHVIICITGFLQEDQNKAEFWENLIAYYKHSEIYAVSWNACTPTSFLIHGTFSKMMINEKQGKDPNKEGRKASKKIFSNLINLINTGKRQFIFAVDQARVTGTLLAMFLAKSSFADNRAVTMIGYSLGSVVTFDCLKILKRLHDFQTKKASRIINDIQFWAGAYVLNLNKDYQEVYDKASYCLVVNGHLNNLYSEKDYALKYGFPMIFKGQLAIGLYPIF